MVSHRRHVHARPLVQLVADPATTACGWVRVFASVRTRQCGRVCVLEEKQEGHTIDCGRRQPDLHGTARYGYGHLDPIGGTCACWRKRRSRRLSCSEGITVTHRFEAIEGT